jgi:hypothetical protein
MSESFEGILNNVAVKLFFSGHVEEALELFDESLAIN